MKIGQTLWWLSIEGEGDTIKPVWEEYVVRTIRKNHVYATWKSSITWGKRSKKNGDYGWLVPTPDWCTERVDEFSSLKTTKLQACNHELKVLRSDRDYYSPEETAILIRKIEAMKKRLKK